MTTRAHLVVNRTDDHVVVLVPDRDEGRCHALVTEEEAYLVSTTIRRMVVSRDARTLTVGRSAAGARVERVAHPALPIEIHLEDEDGTTVVDLSRDDALALADMLWGAHRATGSFHAMTTLVGGVRLARRAEVARTALTPRPDGPEALEAKVLGDLRRRVRGRNSRPDG